METEYILFGDITLQYSRNSFITKTRCHPLVWSLLILKASILLNQYIVFKQIFSIGLVYTVYWYYLRNALLGLAPYVRYAMELCSIKHPLSSMKVNNGVWLQNTLFLVIVNYFLIPLNQNICKTELIRNVKYIRNTLLYKSPQSLVFKNCLLVWDPAV